MTKKELPQVKSGPPRADRLSDWEGIIERGVKYFQDMDSRDRPYTMGGFCSAAGVTREMFRTYGDPKIRGKATRRMKNKRLIEFFEDSRLKILADLEERCLSKTPAGAIFLLKANYGYDDGSRRDTVQQEKDTGNPFKGELTINIRSVK